MAYSESLANRIRDVFAGRPGITEKKMFGSVRFLLHGNMCVGVWNTSMIARLDPEQAATALTESNVIDLDITDYPMKGWVLVEAEGVETDEQLRVWIERAVEFVETLPRKIGGITMNEQTPQSDTKRYWWLAGLAIFVLLLLVAELAFVFFPSGIHVTIQNTGSQPLRSVVLHVTGASYDLGDIPPGSTAQATVRPTSESHLEIEFTDPDGQTQRLDAGGYFESGYKGTIHVSIKDGVIQKNEQNIRLPWSLP